MAAVRGDNPDHLFATPAIVAEHRGDGSTILRSTAPLKPAARCVGDWLEHWARAAPDRIFLGERTGDAPWTTVSYRDVLKQVRSIAAWILSQGLSAERPVAVLSDNSVDHALLERLGVSAPVKDDYSEDEVYGLHGAFGGVRPLSVDEARRFE